MRYGASMDVRFDSAVDSFAAFLADVGLSHVELRAGYLDVNPDEADPDYLRTVAADHGLTYSVHAPHLDAALGNVNEGLRAAAVEQVQASIDLAAAIDAEAVVVHGGTQRTRYPDHVREHVREHAVQSVRACAQYADLLGVPLCLENQRDAAGKHRHTATPDRLAAFLDDVGVDSDYLRLALDVGHAKATGVDYQAFVDRFGDRIRVCHLHDNDGAGDDHDPLPDYEAVAADVGAPVNVLEMKSRDDVRQCVSPSV